MKSINVNGKLLDTIHSWIRTFLDSKVSEESDNKAATAGGGGPLHDSAKIAGSISALGTYCLGNLCRNDASSELVFKMPEIIDSIFEILNKGLEKSNILASRNPETRIGDHSSIVSDIAKSTPLSNPESVDLLKITHAVVGTLRNLSVHS